MASLKQWAKSSGAMNQRSGGIGSSHLLDTGAGRSSLQRKKRGNTFLFSPRITEEEVSERMLGDVVDRVFDGSTAAVLVKLFDVQNVDNEELKELRRLINRKLKESR